LIDQLERAKSKIAVLKKELGILTIPVLESESGQ
jgi:hypothetical protein